MPNPAADPQQACSGHARYRGGNLFEHAAWRSPARGPFNGHWTATRAFSSFAKTCTTWIPYNRVLVDFHGNEPAACQFRKCMRAAAFRASWPARSIRCSNSGFRDCRGGHPHAAPQDRFAPRSHPESPGAQDAPRWSFSCSAAAAPPLRKTE